LRTTILFVKTSRASKETCNRHLFFVDEDCTAFEMGTNINFSHKYNTSPAVPYVQHLQLNQLPIMQNPSSQSFATTVIACIMHEATVTWDVI
jgi:hypothetical protein